MGMIAPFTPAGVLIAISLLAILLGFMLNTLAMRSIERENERLRTTVCRLQREKYGKKG